MNKIPNDLGKNTVKSFDECPFSLSIPDIAFDDGYFTIKSNVKYRKEYDGVVFALFLIEYVDRIGITMHHKIDNSVFDINNGHLMHIDVGVDFGQELSLRNATIKLQFLSINGLIYEVVYRTDMNKKVLFQGVSYAKQNVTEMEAFNNLYSQFKIHLVKKSNILITTNKIDSEGKEYIPESEIADYYKALCREKYYLQKEGGREYKLSNGRRMNISSRGLVTYGFDMESELFLSDDAPLTFKTDGKSATGSVLVCEGFGILIIIDRDFGEIISTAIITVEPWKLLEAQIEKLQSLTPADKVAWKFIKEGPYLYNDGSIEKIDKGHEIAIDKIAKEDITVIWGPPGTGKSYTMAELAIDYIKRGKRILMVSHSNISVDGVINQTVELLYKYKQTELLKNGKILRYGYVRDTKLSDNHDVVAYNYALDRNQNLAEKLESLTLSKDKLIKQGMKYSKEMDTVEKELKKCRTSIREKEAFYASRANMVATTVSKLVVDHVFENVKYDLVMFDEVSMAYVTQLICAAMYSRDKFVCVGDFNQLAPIAQSEAANFLKRDIFSYFGIIDDKGNLHNHEWLVMLDEQRRMLLEISAFPNQRVYHNLLKNHASVEKKRDISKRIPLPGDVMSLVDLSGTYCAAYKNSDNSRFNILSAIVSFGLALTSMDKENKDAIGVITPYAAQARLINAMIKDNLGDNSKLIACATVHQFQGSQRNTIIFDSVESYPGNQAGYLMSKNENRSLERLINVAITRAEGKFITVAHSRFWEYALDGKRNFFKDLVKYLIEKCRIISHFNDKSFDKLLDALNFGRHILYFNDETIVLERLIMEITKAKSNITVSLPSANLLNGSAEILEALVSAKLRGISVNCKTNEFERLPEDWKKITVTSENSIFPLIAIDDNLIWYGVPTATTFFKVKNNHGFNTVMHPYFRLSGKHTIDIIKSLSDIDMRLVDGIKKPFYNNTSTNHNESKNNSGNVFSYVEKNITCKKCGKKMQLTKNYKNNVFCKCSCGEIAYFTVDMGMDYISKCSPTCPICGGDIVKFGVSKYGMWCRCENGDFPKIYEI